MDEPKKHYVECMKPDTKTTCTMIPCIWNTQNRQIYETESRSVAVYNRGRWGEIGGLIGMGFLLGMIKIFQSWFQWWLHDSVNIPKPNELYTLSGWIVWYVNYITIKLLYFKVGRRSGRIIDLDGIIRNDFTDWFWVRFWSKWKSGIVKCTWNNMNDV